MSLHPPLLAISPMALSGLGADTMSGISKRISGSWVSGDYGIMKTDTDTITTPANIYANDTIATVGLKGQMEQIGTPTPDSPIQPSECGELDRQTVNVTYSYNGYNQEIRTGGIADAIKSLTPAKWKFTWDFQSNATQSFKNRMRIYVDGTNRMEISNGSTATITDELLNAIRNAFAYSVMLYYGQDNSDGYFKDFVIDAGYKIPISSASTTTPVYLGETQTTRRIKKLVLTGEETTVAAGGALRFNIEGYLRLADYTICMCSHYSAVANVSSATNLQNDTVTFLVSSSGSNYMYLRDARFINTPSDFEAYLQQQYANGTPVTIWYVLATPETAVVNEPLCKIGDYADTVSGISIPTIAGANSFDVLTTLKPSEVTVNYKGWHPVSSVHERESGAWD